MNDQLEILVPEGQQILKVYGDQNRWAPIFVLDGDTKLYTVSTGSISTSKPLDRFGNKECSHHKISGRIDLRHSLLEEKHQGYYSIPPFNYERFVIGSTTCNRIRLGRQDSNGISTAFSIGRYAYREVLSNTAEDITFLYHSTVPGLSGPMYVEHTKYTLVSANNIEAICECHTVREHYALAKSLISEGWKLPPEYEDTYSTGFNYSGKTYITPRGIDIQDTIDDIYRSIKASLFRNIDRDTHFAGDDLYDRLYTSLPVVEVNNLENLQGLKSLGSTFDPLVDIILKRDLKSVAQAFLSFKYGLMPLKADEEAYLRAYAKRLTRPDKGYSKLKARYSDVQVSDTSKVNVTTCWTVYTPTYRQSVLETLGISPTPSNLWDLVPYSFVLDWFLDVGLMLENSEHIDKITKMDIKSIVVSTKVDGVYSSLPGYPGAQVQLHVIQYERHVVESLPYRVVTSLPRFPFNHVDEGTALILANKR